MDISTRKGKSVQRRFSSYGPVNTKHHYHAPREALIQSTGRQLLGDFPEEGGHYITVWAPRQSGKTWLMQQVAKAIRDAGEFEVAIISMQSAKTAATDQDVLRVFRQKLEKWFDRKLPEAASWDRVQELFTRRQFDKPLILILDEFDALREDYINKFANEFRDIHLERQNQANKPSGSKSCLLHGLALIGVRSVLGIDNVSGSPFNVQRSVHIPNLTEAEVAGMFRWYEKDSGQPVDADVVARLYAETLGQPGLTCWFGELITETYNNTRPEPIRMRQFEIVRAAATKALPNNTILNIISKADREPYRSTVLDLFRTESKTVFSYDDSRLNYLYQNGIIDRETENEIDYFVKFSSPFVQKRLFNYFAREIFRYTGKTSSPFENLTHVISEDRINVENLIRRYEAHLRENREWMLRDAPRRKDLRLFEAVYHFNLYRYLSDFLEARRGRIWPEFPTGNGKVDLIIQYAGLTYALEIKSFTDETGHREALFQAARYGALLNLPEIYLIFFVESIDDANRKFFENVFQEEATGVRVVPMFVETEP